MYGVIRFLDTELLPASSPEDYPKIIKSGIDEEGQHPKSPAITGPCGIATLLHRVGRPQLLERLLDIDGTKEFDLRTITGSTFFQDVYVQRRGNKVEIGFISSDGEWAHHGVRYLILPTTPPYRVGAWSPVSTSDLGSAWGGSQIWVRGQGAAVAKAIWFHQHFNNELEVSWSGISDSEKEELGSWLEERAERLRQEKSIQEIEYKKREALHGDKHFLVEQKMGMDLYRKSLLACRAGCGEENPKLTCSKCKKARYCNAACQKEDWKYHKTLCGVTD